MEYTLLQNSSFEVKNHSGTSIFKVGENGNVYVGATQITPASYVSTSANNTFTGTNTFNGDVTFGAYIDSDLVPKTTDTKNLGSASYKWQNAYIGVLFGATYNIGVDAIVEFFNNKKRSLISQGIQPNFFNLIEKSTDATFSLATAITNCLPEYKGYIGNSGNSAINLTFNGVTKIMTNDTTGASVSGNVLTLGAGVTVEFSIVGGHMIVVNWDVV